METHKVEQPLAGRSLEDIAEILHGDYHNLDEPFPERLEGKLIIGHEKSAVGEAYPTDVQVVKPPKFLEVFKSLRAIYDPLRALWLLGAADQSTCILVDGGHRFGMITCIFNTFMPKRKRKIILWEMYIPTGKLKQWLARRIILGSSFTAVYSRRQLEAQAELLKVPTSKLIFMPYKSLHSASPPIKMEIGSFVFSGGNSKRDYNTLFEAVRGTGIPVIVSATNAKAYAGLDMPDNVIVLAAREPAFARLMAAGRFVVIPILPALVRGAGEASVCDAMWHGRPVICADEISAFEYIDDGVTGYVTPPGNAAMLRERILELWNQHEKVARMGHAAHQAVAANFTHEHFSRRLRALAAMVASSK
jgi:hypothetical protein